MLMEFLTAHEQGVTDFPPDDEEDDLVVTILTGCRVPRVRYPDPMPDVGVNRTGSEYRTGDTRHRLFVRRGVLFVRRGG